MFDERYPVKAIVLEPATSTSEEFRALIETDLKRWGKVVKDANIHVQ